VTLTGTGLAPRTKFVASPSTVNFGNVAVDHTATMMINVRNAGNQPSLIQRTGTNGGAFGAPLKATRGLELSGDNNLVLPVSFHPTKAGPYSGIYKVTWTDAFGTHSLNVPITGTGV
jgi:Abnormal spindle-like microcephaly-assoc'd, ASPM-SPD-2-Hydin